MDLVTQEERSADVEVAYDALGETDSLDANAGEQELK